MEWHRRKDEYGGTYYVEQRGRYMIDKKITDDREYDGGYLVTEWILHSRDSGGRGFSPIEARETLAAAKQLAEQFA